MSDDTDDTNCIRNVNFNSDVESDIQERFEGVILMLLCRPFIKLSEFEGQLNGNRR